MRPLLDSGIVALYILLYMLKMQISPPVVPSSRVSPFAKEKVYWRLRPVFGSWQVPYFR